MGEPIVGDGAHAESRARGARSSEPPVGAALVMEGSLTGT
jgi:hypothetical protein